VSAFAKRVAEAEKYGTPVTHGNLDAIRNYTDARDIVKAYTKAIFLESGIYNLCSDVTISAAKVMETYIKFASKPVETIENKFLFRSSSSKFPKPNCEKFKNLTNWSPQIAIEETLLDTLNYWRKIV
jgi:GDP-4-dehydro-6-deoxy-D-mannose reductase